MSERRVLFVHIPKTGGESLWTALLEWASLERSRRFWVGDMDDLESFLTLPRLEEFKLLAGHLSYEQFKARLDRTGETWSPITIVREPGELVRSNYDYVRRTPEHSWHDQVSRESLAEYVARVPHGLNLQCLQIGGSPATADRAFATLQSEFLLTSAIENIDRLVARLSDHLGTTLTLPRLNAADHEPTPIDDEARAMIAEQNVEDAELYRRVREAGLVGTGA